MKRQLRSLNRSVEEPIINLTPLIDVVFVILIMFIVVAPLLELDRVELADARGEKLSQQGASLQESSPIAIHVHRDNSIFFGHQQVSISQLTEELKHAKKRYPSVRPQLFHDRRGQFGVYQSVKNAVETAGFEEMDVVLKP